MNLSRIYRARKKMHPSKYVALTHYALLCLPFRTFSVPTHDWKWSVDAVLGHNVNKLKKLYGDNPDILFITKLHLALSAENLFTITPYSGVDPEIAPVAECYQ